MNIIISTYDQISVLSKLILPFKVIGLPSALMFRAVKPWTMDKAFSWFSVLISVSINSKLSTFGNVCRNLGRYGTKSSNATKLN